MAWQNDNLHEAVGQHVKDRATRTLYILAPNYPAGQDALTGFKRFYDRAKLAGEVYTQLGQKDYAAEIAAMRAPRPDAVFFFLPGGMGISFLKQYQQAGLVRRDSRCSDRPSPFRPGHPCGAVGDAALGV